MNRWRCSKRGITSIEIILLVIMICVLIATGILIHNKAQQVKVVNAIRDAVNTEIETKQNIKDYNAIVRINCSTIQTLIQAELANSDYKELKSYLTTNDGEIFFYESDIRIPNDGIQPRNGSNQKGWVVISFDDSLERFLINGNAFDGSNILTEPLIAQY